MEFLLTVQPFFYFIVAICCMACFVLAVSAIVLVVGYSEAQSDRRAALRFAVKKVCFLFCMFGAIGAASFPLSQPLDIYSNIIMYRSVSQQLSGAPKNVVAKVHFESISNLFKGETSLSLKEMGDKK